MKNKLVVKKDNALINAAYTLTLAEQRLILLAVATAGGQKGDLTSLTLHARDYADQYKLSPWAAYKALQEATETLFERRITFYENKGAKKTVTRWVSHVGYMEGEGTIELSFAPKVQPLLCELKNRFTAYNLEALSELTSAYAIRLYELLIAWKSTGRTPKITIEDFREKLGIKNDKYSRMTDFKRWVLDAAIEQINTHTDIKASYEQHKKGRRIAAFSFTFTVRNERDPNTIDMLTGKSDKESWPKKRKKISRKEAEQMAYPGEECSDLLARIGTEYLVDMNTPSDDGAP